MENIMKFGPEEMEGSIWDERGKTNIEQILISYGNDAVYSIQFVYVVDGKMLASEIHGKSRGLNFQIVTFDHPREYLTSVTGQITEFGSGRLVSITFGTNKRKYGPFGKVKLDSRYYYETPFSYIFGPKCSFGGFHGSVFNSYLYAIGIYVKAPGSVAETETDDCGIKVEKETDNCRIKVRKVKKMKKVESTRFKINAMKLIKRLK